MAKAYSRGYGTKKIGNRYYLYQTEVYTKKDANKKVKKYKKACGIAKVVKKKRGKRQSYNVYEIWTPVGCKKAGWILP